MKVIRKADRLETEYKGKRLTFFATNKGSRKLQLKLYLRSREDGNILWYLYTKDTRGNPERFYLKLEEMDRLGLLLLLLSKFCANTLFLSDRSVKRILEFEAFWRELPAR